MSGLPITPVLMGGGEGSHLWPLSRPDMPKQFLALDTGDPGNGGDGSGTARSLIAATALRLSGPGFAAPVVATATRFAARARAELAAAGIHPAAILAEPTPRNTAPALAAALAWLERTGTAPETPVLMAPCDHGIDDRDAFLAALTAGRAQCDAGAIVLLGATPTRAETGYGYITMAAPDAGGGPVTGFAEKPDAARADALWKDGQHLWNAGLVLARRDVLLAAFERHAPAILTAARTALAAVGTDDAGEDGDVVTLTEAPWREAPAISVDHALLEPEAARNTPGKGTLWAVPLDGTGDKTGGGSGWHDLGSWEAHYTRALPRQDGIVTEGAARAEASRDSYLRAEAGAPALLGLGLSRIVAVSTAEAVLVADRDHLHALPEAAQRLPLAAPQDPAVPMDPVAIITPSYNSAATLPRALASVQAQDHQNWEMWVIDDASTDGTAELMATLMAKEPRLRSIRLEEQGGASTARNAGLLAAQSMQAGQGDGRQNQTKNGTPKGGRYIAFLDADDAWRPGKLSRQIALMKAHGAGLSYTGFTRVTGARRHDVRVPPVVDRARLLNGNVIACSSAMIDTAITGPVEMPAMRRRQDFATWLGILDRIPAAWAIPEPLLDLHTMPGSLSSARAKALRANWALYRDHLGLGPVRSAWHMGRHLAGRLRRG